MEASDLMSYVAGVAAVVIGLSVGGFVFGMIVHESSHAMICLLFGLPYSWSLTQVVYEKSPEPLVNNLVGLAGGMGQALFSLLFFWYARVLLTKLKDRVLWRKILNGKKSPLMSILFGFEVAFLTIAFHGIITGIVEGLFYEIYEQTHDNLLLWGTILVLCGIVSFFILYKRQSRLLK